MNYKLHYNKLIERARNRKLQGYTERHHIVPRSMNGSDDKDNLVKLTAREHFIAHILLVKIYPKEYGLIKAVNMMTIGHIKHRNKNRMYGWLKEKFSEEMSRSQTGEGNSQFGTIWIYNLDLKRSKKVKYFEIEKKITEGWKIGRKINFEPSVSELNKLEKKRINKELKIEKENNIKTQTKLLFKKYMESDYISLNSFAKDHFNKSLVTLTKRFIKYINGYEKASKQGSQKAKEKFKIFCEY